MTLAMASKVQGFDLPSRIINVREDEYFVRLGGDRSGPPVLLLHGHTQASEMWSGLAFTLAAQGAYVIAIDLRGIARSSKPSGGYKKVSQARDIHIILEQVGALDRPVSVVAHDLGVMVAYPLVRLFEESFSTLVLMEATVPGIGIWPHLLQNIKLSWHFGFYGQHAENILAGRERAYLDRFWSEFSVNPASINELDRQRYASYYQLPDGVRGALSHFSTFEEDAIDNMELAKVPLSLPILGIGGSESLGPAMEAHVADLGVNSSGRIIKDAGHWLMEEAFEATCAEILHHFNRVKEND